MITLEVKICGITREQDLKAAVEAGADSLGFVVGVPSSARNLSLHEARGLIAKAATGTHCVAVTAFSTLAELIRICEVLKPDYLQLHGDLHSLKSTAIPPTRMIVAVDGKSPGALTTSLEMSKKFRFVLLDSADDKGLGGTGIAHDWALGSKIRDAIFPSPLILAGGLTPANVRRASEIVKPYGVDVSSGVEKQPGIKDHDKLFEFIRNAKEAKT
jgi:phosphoribosylanthranilate isomerase